jgi:VanZ family protein
MDNNISSKEPGLYFKGIALPIRYIFINLSTPGYTKTLGIINILLALALLIAGLWPFQLKPANTVGRITGHNGIITGNNCLIYEKRKYENPGILSFLKSTDEMTIECLVRASPAIDDNFAVILCLYDDFDPELLMIGKWKSDLILRRRIPLGGDTYTYHFANAENVIRPGKQYHLMVSMERRGTSIFINGKELKQFTGFRLITGKESTAGYRIILGNDPRVKGPWTGEIQGLALYDTSHNAHDAMKHFLDWSKHDFESLSKGKGIVALYPMNEGRGPVLKNIITKKGELIIPDYLYALKKSPLSLPWMEFWKYWIFYFDLLINILGFIPLGFFLMAFFVSCNKKMGVVSDIVTVLTGSCISLFIEMAQVWMPSRTSSLTDLICNIIGTILGVVIFHTSYAICLSKTKKPDGSGFSATSV